MRTTTSGCRLWFRRDKNRADAYALPFGLLKLKGYTNPRVLLFVAKRTCGVEGLKKGLGWLGWCKMKNDLGAIERGVSRAIKWRVLKRGENEFRATKTAHTKELFKDSPIKIPCQVIFLIVVMGGVGSKKGSAAFKTRKRLLGRMFHCPRHIHAVIGFARFLSFRVDGMNARGQIL